MWLQIFSKMTEFSLDKGNFCCNEHYTTGCGSIDIVIKATVNVTVSNSKKVDFVLSSSLNQQYVCWGSYFRKHKADKQWSSLAVFAAVNQTPYGSDRLHCASPFGLSGHSERLVSHYWSTANLYLESLRTAEVNQIWPYCPNGSAKGTMWVVMWARPAVFMMSTVSLLTFCH